MKTKIEMEDEAFTDEMIYTVAAQLEAYGAVLLHKNHIKQVLIESDGNVTIELDRGVNEKVQGTSSFI